MHDALRTFHKGGAEPLPPSTLSISQSLEYSLLSEYLPFNCRKFRHRDEVLPDLDQVGRFFTAA